MNGQWIKYCVLQTAAQQFFSVFHLHLCSFTPSTICPFPPLHAFSSPVVSPELASSSPGHLQDPVAWQKAVSPLCWLGRWSGGYPHCWGWWWSLSGGPRPGWYCQSSAESQSRPEGPRMFGLRSESLTWPSLRETPLVEFLGC